MRPIIGITQCLDASGRWKPGREYGYGDLATVRAVEAAGGLPMLLPLQADPDALLERVDALLLPGGDDFLPPTPYPPEVAFEATPKAQLDFDARLLSGALERGLPFFGICYGMQQLALQLGGSLHYHLPLDLPEAGEHSLAEADGRHGIEIEKDTRLAALLGEHPRSVNSLHHQAVAQVGTRLRVSARSPDGVVEAIESNESGFCIGVQWHPERLSDTQNTALFRAFVAAAAHR